MLSLLRRNFARKIVKPPGIFDATKQKPSVFDATKSKYSMDNQLKSVRNENKNEMPKYMANIQKFEGMVQKSYEKENPEDIKVRDKENKANLVIQKAKDQKEFDMFTENKHF